MGFFITEIKNLQFKKTYYHSVRLENKDVSEFKDFYLRSKLKVKDEIEFLEICAFLGKIGNKTGALDEFFKPERNAERVLVPYIENDSEDDFGLRMYCFRQNEQVVILLGGTRKTAQKVQDCPDCYPYFLQANNYSVALDRAFGLNEIQIVDTYLITPVGYNIQL